MTSLEEIVEETLESMIQLQRQKVLKVARAINPRVTPEDIRNPQDLPDLYEDPGFNYEDGILTGYLSVQMSLRAKLREPLNQSP